MNPRPVGAVTSRPGKSPIFRTITEAVWGSAALLAISVNTIVLTLLLCVLSTGKFLAPTAALRDRVRRLLASIAETWISVNNGILSMYRGTRWDIELPDGLSHDGSYLVACNHRSWVDILVLQRCFNRRIPLLRFFLKRELIRVPFLGMAWWALDFPFVRRHSREELEKRPDLRGRDLENARRACEKFRTVPVAMMTFPEGTRYSERKRDKSHSPFRNLLKPRIGGLGQVLYALGDRLDSLIDVTIVYPVEQAAGAAPTFWDLLTGRVPRIVAHARRVEIPADLLCRDFRTDPAFYSDLRRWIRELWREKEALIARLEEPSGGA